MLYSSQSECNAEFSYLVKYDIEKLDLESKYDKELPLLQRRIM